MSDDRAIGFFDSGLGGLSVWLEANKLLPLENTIYLADSKYAPYGPRSKQEIIDLSRKNVEYLLERQCKAIVIACNTATTKAIDVLRAEYDVPFIGIEPAIKPAALSTRTNSIGVLATQGTLVSELFLSTSEKYAKDVITVSQRGTGLVELIENGELGSQRLRDLLIEYITPMVEQNIDYLVLGCTHYPFLRPILREILPESIQVIDSGEAVARRIAYILESQQIINKFAHTTHTFYTNRSASIMEAFMDEVCIDYEPKFLNF